MIRALPAGRSPGAIALGLVGAVFLSVGLSGCPGSLDASLLDARTGGGGDGGGQTTCSTSQAMAVLTASNHNCSQTGCHTGAAPASGFDMTVGSGFETHLVGGNPSASSLSCGSNGPYLQPGMTPAKGLFLAKLTASFPCGSEMPLVGDKLSASEMACIQSWADGLVAAAGTGGGSDGGGQ